MKSIYLIIILLVYKTSSVQQFPNTNMNIINGNNNLDLMKYLQMMNSFNQMNNSNNIIDSNKILLAQISSLSNGMNLNQIDNNNLANINLNLLAQLSNPLSPLNNLNTLNNINLISPIQNKLNSSINSNLMTDTSLNNNNIPQIKFKSNEKLESSKSVKNLRNENVSEKKEEEEQFKIKDEINQLTRLVKQANNIIDNKNSNGKPDVQHNSDTDKKKTEIENSSQNKQQVDKNENGPIMTENKNKEDDLAFLNKENSSLTNSVNIKNQKHDYNEKETEKLSFNSNINNSYSTQLTDEEENKQEFEDKMSYLINKMDILYNIIEK